MRKDCPLEPGSAVWGYFRDSGGEAQERSVTQQIEVAREYASRHGLRLTSTFSDEARSGSSTTRRDALQDMLTKARQFAPDARNRQSSAPDGILFWDTIIRESVPDCYADLGYKTVSTNPCGEIPLCPYDSCRLLAINLFSYVENPFTSEARFDFDLFYRELGLERGTLKSAS